MKICALLAFACFLIHSSTSFVAPNQPEAIAWPSLPPAEARWSGTVSQHQKWSGITGSSERWVEVSFSEAVPTMYRNVNTTDLNFTDDKGTGTVKIHGVSDLPGSHGETNCASSGLAELHAVTIREFDNTYDIEVRGPTCKGGLTVTTPGGSEPYNEEGDLGASITITQPLGSNHNLLTGSVTTNSDVAGLGKGTETVSWTLVRGPIDADLIVTPVGYDVWLPKPGHDELSKGSVMDIKLEVRGRNGRPLAFKVVRFELKLSNTSREPGITINFPLKPSQNQLPDIRFLPGRIGESIEEDQSVTVDSHDGQTGQAVVASYDGGGWTTLTAEAVLEGGLRIKGHLLNPTGVEQILIPKRDPAKKIASSWLAANGNPGERDDAEQDVNTNKGDGLTAYEEYRGVIALDQNGSANTGPTFMRLNPRRKELGVKTNLGDSNFFSKGVDLFERASGIKVIRFSENEIGDNRRLNANSGWAHDYDQYVLKLEEGNIGGDVAGENVPKELVAKFPAQSERIVIDNVKIHQAYAAQEAAAQAANVQMPYTEEESLANTVAHEMAHGVHVDHHGIENGHIPQNREAFSFSQPPYEIHLSPTAPPMTNIPPAGFLLSGNTGTVGNDESGDLSCIMAYTSFYNWAFHLGPGGELVYYKVPLLKVGNIFCRSRTGTGINAGGAYFGDAMQPYGDCMSQFKLRP
jgi:hypothetical protein